MTDFTREIKILPGYDHRDDPGGQGGAHGCDMLLILAGELGAITAEISTGWMTRPLAGRMVRGQAQSRREKPGIDAGLVDQYPSGSYVGSHSPIRRGEYDTVRDSCGHLGGAPCFSDGSYLAADRILDALVAGGSDAAFGEMAGLYRSWLADRPPYRPELPVGADDVIDVESYEVREIEAAEAVRDA
jgi:hypothetical protein